MPIIERGERVAQYGKFRLYTLYNMKSNTLMSNYEVVLEDETQADGELLVMTIPREMSDEQALRLALEKWVLYAERTLHHAQTEAEKIRHEMSADWFDNHKNWESQWKSRMQKVKEATVELPWS